MEDISTVLATLRQETENADIINALYQLEDFYERKLWHQLTTALEELYSIPDSRHHGLQKKIYTQFIGHFLLKLNAIRVTDFLLSSFQDNKTECLEKLEEFQNQIKLEIKKSARGSDDTNKLVDNNEAIVYTDLQKARFYIYLNKLDKADEVLERLEPKFESSYETDFNAKITAAFYLAKCQLDKLNENYNKFYANALLYLSSLEGSIPHDEQVSLCYDLCVAALLGTKIYNFGELILHDILNVIKGSEYDWLYQLVHSLNAGELGQFSQLLPTAFQNSPFLANSEAFLHQKIVIMALLELVSRKSSANKTLTFKEISDFTGTPIEEIEQLIIKCFSLNLIQGYIEETNQILIVTWLQPRILNLDQVKVLFDQLTRWDNQVEKLGEKVRADGGSIWAGI